MLKEKYENAKKFEKEPKTDIIAGTICLGTTVALGILVKQNKEELKNLIDNKLKMQQPEIPNVDVKKDVEYIKQRVMDITDLECRLDDLYDIANNSLGREESRINFEIAELENYIQNLDHTKTINVFHRIPEKEKRINELKTQLNDIKFDKNVIKDTMEIIWKL